MTTREAAQLLGVTSAHVSYKCGAYRRRLEAIKAEGREPTIEEKAPRAPRELRCIVLGPVRSSSGPALYLVERTQLDNFPVNVPDTAGKRGVGRPAGAGRGVTPTRRKPVELDRRFKANRHLPPSSE
jgi:hypothetical protein